MDSERFNKEVGEWLREARTSRGWSMAKASERSGGRFHPAVIGSYETGARGMSAATVMELAEFYGLNLKSVMAMSWLAAGGQVPQQRAA